LRRTRTRRPRAQVAPAPPRDAPDDILGSVELTAQRPPEIRIAEEPWITRCSWGRPCARSTPMDLAPATSYTLTVEANDFNGNTTMSNAVFLMTEATNDVTPPSAPTNVRIVEDQGCAEVWRLDPVHGRHRPAVRDRVRDLRQRRAEPASRRSRNRQGLRLRHGAWRQHVHGESGGSGGEHLGGEQRVHGVPLALLRSGLGGSDGCCRVGRRPNGLPCSTVHCGRPSCGPIERWSAPSVLAADCFESSTPPPSGTGGTLAPRAEPRAQAIERPGQR
jgi:hypothetical protein